MEKKYLLVPYDWFEGWKNEAIKERDEGKKVNVVVDVMQEIEEHSQVIILGDYQIVNPQ